MPFSAVMPLLAGTPSWLVLTKAAWFAAVCALIGATLLHVAVLRPALNRHADAQTSALAARTSRIVVAILAAALVLAVPFRLISISVGEGSFADAARPSALQAYVTAAAPGGGWLTKGAVAAGQGLLALLALMLALAALRAAQPIAERLATAVLVPAVGVQALKAVPAGSADLRPNEIADTVLTQGHILAAGAWMGGLVTLVALSGQRSSLDAPLAFWRTLWRRFSVLASACLGIVVVSGVWLTWKSVGSVGQFVGTDFGRALTVKIVLVAVVLGLGAYNQLRLIPRITRLHRAGIRDSALRLAVHHFGRVIATELALGIGIMLAVGLLVGSARVQAGGAEPPPSGSVLGWIGVLALAVVALFVLADRLARFLSTRPPASPHRSENAAGPRP